MKSKLVIVGVLLLTVVGGYFYYVNSDNENNTAVTEKIGSEELQTNVLEANDQNEEQASETDVYTISQIEQHNNPQDCWLVIDNNVYDVTKFIADQKHPGGDAIVEGCGIDATQLFNTRPMGSGTPHSDRAKDTLKNFMIGELSN
ncbi:hypothetical protein IPM62_05070 [Candidatus Woesebacteria bacterium]|nr:MAG: hypothetical protein IPM62_05070 [Candidatus Woesebacteria bacterium]